ncbi:putative nuclease HARBI1 [Topomyia yanbarensis]|uniref:putative nuclease HARBI1 n=1 Tax=Topomyia yanbarensis TaxID=2498891 RepID=UPI00273B9958|nr:putative nuclease HARBI1 [Topomyia yanbarensis]
MNLLSSGSYQINVGGSFVLGMAQPTVSLVFNETITLLENFLCEQWIVIEPRSFNTTKAYFFNKFKIPGVVGCIDGTHIPILKPTQDEHMFFNRKGFHSINAMIITDQEYRIMAVNSRYGGAAHDSFVWSMSDERQFFQEGFHNGDSRLLGDSGYALAPWLLTPYRSANEGSGEEIFNTIHSTARCSVERGIGVLKARWRCLSSDRKLRSVFLITHQKNQYLYKMKL